MEFLSSVIFFASNNFLLPSLEKEIWQQNIANHLIQKQNIYIFVQTLYIISNFFIHFQYTFDQYFQNGSIKVKCTAMLQNVYLKSNEISFEVKKRLQNIPALEIREKNGKKNSKGKSYSKSLIRLGL